MLVSARPTLLTSGLTTLDLSWELKFRLKLNKVGKTTRPFRYDLNQIPYDYTVKVTDSKD